MSTAPMAAELPAVAAFLRDVKPLFTAEKPVSFDPVQMAFLQALVRESALTAGVAIAKADFFKGTVYLDYFTEVIAGRATLLQDVEIIARELEKMHEYLDPDLALLVRYSGLYAVKELKPDRLFGAAALRQMARRHAATNHAAAAGGPAGAPDVFDLAVARMVGDLVTTPELRARLGAALGRNDLRAAIFADSILAALPPAAGAATLAAAQLGDFHGAAVAATRALVQHSAGWSLEAHVRALQDGLRG